MKEKDPNIKIKVDAAKELIDKAPIQFFIDQAIIKTTECFLNCGQTEEKCQVLELLTRARLISKKFETEHGRKK